MVLTHSEKRGAIHLLNGSSNEILDKIVACNSSSNKMINGDQFHEETMQHMVSEALAEGRVKMLGGASLEDVLGSSPIKITFDSNLANDSGDKTVLSSSIKKLGTRTLFGQEL